MTALRRRIRRRMIQVVELLAEIPSTGTMLSDQYDSLCHSRLDRESKKTGSLLSQE
jgi:hypothetical protein